MQVIQSILSSQPRVSTKVLSTGGLCVWICWSKGKEARVVTMLEESGGLEIANTGTQSLWFFFGVEVTLYALAKLDIWGKQFSTGLTSFTFPGDLVVGPDRTLTVEIDAEYQNMTTGDPQSIVYIFTHPALWPYATSMPGISFYDMTILEKQGLFGWKMITADRRLPFSAEHGWFAFLHPVGNPLDKNYQKGWGKIFANIEPLLQDSKLKYALQSGFLSVSIANIEQLRAWVEQILIIFDDIREHHQDIYWPCLSVIVDKNNLNFTTDLHEKLDIDWGSLCPDHPYLNYKNGFLLGQNFTIHDLHYSSQPTNIEALCTVSLKSLDVNNSTIRPLIAKVLAPSNNTACFYCGSGTHSGAECPTKQLEPLDPDFWHHFDDFDFGEINASYQTIDAEVNAHGIEAYANIIAHKDATARLLQATFAINSACQVPNIARIWQITSRDMDEIPEKTNPQKEPVWAILKRLSQETQDLNAIERDCLNQIAKNPKNWHLRCIYGFITMERGDYEKAAIAWREAESLCTTTTHQAWIKFLIARLREIQGFHLDASESYKHIKSLLPAWQELDYRILVCQVKMGFGQNTAKHLETELGTNPEIFHKVLVDPELARGHSQILLRIFPIWENAYNLFLIDRKGLEELLQTLTDWFDEDENPVLYYGSKIRTLLGIGPIKNFLLFMEFAEFKPRFETDLIRIINKGVAELKQGYEKCLNQVEFIRDEMNWFYFQRVLVDFNTTFNDCARLLNWAFVSNFNDVAIFKEALQKLPELQGFVDKLRGKLTRLRVVRDITLFALLMLKTFFKTATFLVGLSILGIFVLLFYGDSFNMSWFQDIIKANFWELLKVVLSITLMLSLGLASLKTTVLFESKRNKLLEAAKEERLRAQQGRLNKAKKQRRDEEDKAKRKAERNSRFA